MLDKYNDCRPERSLSQLHRERRSRKPALSNVEGDLRLLCTVSDFGLVYRFFLTGDCRLYVDTD